MVNHRTTCTFCKNQVLSREIGLHYLKKHQADLFTGDNLKSLHRDRYLEKPLELCIGTDTFFFCLADNSCIRRSLLADEHFKGKKDGHRNSIITLREKYPLDNKQPENKATETPLMTQKELKWLQELIMDVTASKDVALTQHCRSAFRKLGLKVEEDELRPLFPDHEHWEEKIVEKPEEELISEEDVQEEKEEQPEKEEPEDEDTLPLLLPKPMTKEEVFQHLMSKKDIKNLTTSIVSGKTIEIPEIQQYSKTTTIKRPTDIDLFTANQHQQQQQQPQIPIKIVTNTKRIAKQVTS